METFIQNLSIKKQVGAGGFGRIFLAQNPKDECFAVKGISKSKGQAQNIGREVQAGNKLHHKSITNFVCHFEDDNNDFLVFDYIKGMEGKPEQILTSKVPTSFPTWRNGLSNR
jgi:serine/threonine protein kinase